MRGLVCVCVCVRVPMCMCVSFYYNVGLLSIHRFNKAIQFSVSAVCPVTKVTVYSVIVLLFLNAYCFETCACMITNDKLHNAMEKSVMITPPVIASKGH
jgi:hypothetical protein